jgi:hypothetical protein
MSKQSRKVFPPLFTILVSDLEFVLPFTDHLPFCEMLEGFSLAEPSRSGPLKIGIGKELANRKRGRDAIREHFDHFRNAFLALFDAPEAQPSSHS